MKSFSGFFVRYNYLWSYPLYPFLIYLILFLTSCTVRHKPYSIIEFTGESNVLNYSKSAFLAAYQPDSVNPVAILGSIGDLFMFDGDNLFIYNDTSSHNRFSVKYLDRVLYVNDKIYSIDIPDNDNMIPWFENMNEKDFSALQFIRIRGKVPESYIPYLRKLAEIKPDAGLSGIEDFKDIAELLKIFKPRCISAPGLHQRDYDLLSGLTSVETLMLTLEDSVINDPLPGLPALKHLFLGETEKHLKLTNDLLANNKQIETVFIQKEGSFDFSMLKPLENLKELVVSGAGTVINLDLINNHKKLEVLSLVGDEVSGKGSIKIDYNPALIRLPSLRWMTFYSNVTQEEFNSFIDAHPDLETVQLIANDTIRSLKALSKLSRLNGLIVTDTLTDISSIETLMNLKYLSLPGDFLEDSANKAGLQKSLPYTRIVANEGFCLGSGWLLLLIPVIVIIRFFGNHKNKILREG